MKTLKVLVALWNILCEVAVVAGASASLWRAFTTNDEVIRTLNYILVVAIITYRNTWKGTQ